MKLSLRLAGFHFTRACTYKGTIYIYIYLGSDLHQKIPGSAPGVIYIYIYASVYQEQCSAIIIILFGQTRVAVIYMN
jgi:hypothetical protein